MTADFWPTLFVFVLASLIGLGVIRRVSRLLHTPLMSITNAISAIVIVGVVTYKAVEATGIMKAIEEQIAPFERAVELRAAADRLAGRVVAVDVAAELPDELRHRVDVAEARDALERRLALGLAGDEDLVVPDRLHLGERHPRPR